MAYFYLLPLKHDFGGFLCINQNSKVIKYEWEDPLPILVYSDILPPLPLHFPKQKHFTCLHLSRADLYKFVALSSFLNVGCSAYSMVLLLTDLASTDNSV